MAKHWKTISIMDDNWDFDPLEVEVLEGFDFKYAELVEDYYTSLGNAKLERDFFFKHQLVCLGAGHFGEVFGLDDNIAIKLLHNLGEELPDGYILSQLNDCDMTPNVYAYSDSLDGSFMIVDRVRGFNICDVGKHAGVLLEFDLDRNLNRISHFIDACYRAEILPSDIHQANVMCDFDGNMMVVDVGCFEYGTFDPNSKDVKWAYEDAKSRLIYQAHLMDHIVNNVPMKDIEEGLPSRFYFESGLGVAQ